MKCLCCNKEILEEEARKIEEAGVEPFCDNYCCNMYSGGVPMPWDGINTIMTEDNHEGGV